MFGSFDHFGKSMFKQTEQQREKLKSLWLELYGTDLEVERAQEENVMKRVVNLLNDMIKEEEDNKEKTIERIEGLIKEQATLEKELHTEIKADVNKSAPLFKIEASLQSILKAYRIIKIERLEKLGHCVSKESRLCDRLGMIPKYSCFEGVPSETELGDMQKLTCELECEEAKREEVFADTKKCIVELLSRLETIPTSFFEIMVVEYSKKDFILSDDNMKRLEEFLTALKMQEVQAKNESKHLLGYLSLIWERLKESNERQEEFLITHAGYGKSAINGLKQEVQRCQQLTRQDIERHIQEIRNELESWWDRLHYSHDQREQTFPSFHSRDFCEELLELLEQEVRNLKKFFEDNRAIYQLVDKRNKLWEKMMELSDKGKDSDRLFKNRGGQLLKEEKERKRTAQELPKIEEQLKKLLLDFEARTGSAFLIDGIPFLEHMEDQWKKHKAREVAQKMARKVANSTLALTPSEVLKRKCQNTPCSPQTEVSKRARISENQSSSSQVNNPVIIPRLQNTSSAEKVTNGRVPWRPGSRSAFPFKNPAKDMLRSFSFRNH